MSLILRRPAESGQLGRGGTAGGTRSVRQYCRLELDPPGAARPSATCSAGRSHKQARMGMGILFVFFSFGFASQLTLLLKKKNILVVRLTEEARCRGGGACPLPPRLLCVLWHSHSSPSRRPIARKMPRRVERIKPSKWGYNLCTVE
ncbi:hypothetical protein GQ53DRAFT_95776 [Thozetella sp. PMI_491]|nr:hypothetical protein GQ53DRAFT_95776 [Thozetella sp. PMI_491]